MHNTMPSSSQPNAQLHAACVAGFALSFTLPTIAAEDANAVPDSSSVFFDKKAVLTVAFGAVAVTAVIALIVWRMTMPTESQRELVRLVGDAKANVERRKAQKIMKEQREQRRAAARASKKSATVKPEDATVAVAVAADPRSSPGTDQASKSSHRSQAASSSTSASHRAGSGGSGPDQQREAKQQSRRAHGKRRASPRMEDVLQSGQGAHRIQYDARAHIAASQLRVEDM